MNNKGKIVLITILILGAIFLPIAIYYVQTTRFLDQSITINGVDYENHDSIFMTGNIECDNFFSGNGTDGSEGNPYILEYLYFGDLFYDIQLYNINRYITIQNCYFNSTVTYGIEIGNCSNLIVYNCTFYNVTLAFYTLAGASVDCTNITIDKNRFIDCNTGMAGWYVDNITVSNNYCDGCSYFMSTNDYSKAYIFNNIITNTGYGIYANGLDNNYYTIYNNTFNCSSENVRPWGGSFIVSENTFYGSADAVYGYGHDLNVINNFNPLYIGIWDFDTCILENNTISYIFLNNVDNTYIHKNNFTCTPNIYQCDNVNITNNNFTSDQEGLYVDFCTNITIDNNSIDVGYTGISVEDSLNCTISNNYIIAATHFGYTQFGVSLSNTNDSQIIFNDIYAGNGFYLYKNSTGLNISSNYIFLYDNQHMTGFDMGISSYNNVSQNIVILGNYGIWLNVGHYNSFDHNIVSNNSDPYPETWGDNYNDTNIVNITPNIEHISNKNFTFEETPYPIVELEIIDDGYNKTAFQYSIYRQSTEIDSGICDDKVSIEINTDSNGTFNYRVEVSDGYYYSYYGFQVTIGEVPSNTTIITENQTITTNNITIEWMNVVCDGYYILINGTEYADTTNLFAPLSVLTENKTYLITIIAYNTYGNSTESNVCEITTFFDLMPEVTIIITENQTVDDGIITIEWESRESAEGYYVYVNNILNATVSGDFIAFTFDLVNATYSIYVVSYNEYGNSVPSNICEIKVEIITEEHPPEEPTDNTVWIYVGVGGGVAVAGVVGYFVYRNKKKVVPKVASMHCKKGERWNGKTCVPI